MAPEWPSATAHQPVDAQPPVDGEPVDILMQDTALGRVALDCSMSETAVGGVRVETSVHNRN